MIDPTSVHKMNGENDGHVNRNIRIALALIKMSKPYIEIVSVKDVEDELQEVKWRVAGCHTIDEARARFFNNRSEEDVI